MKKKIIALFLFLFLTACSNEPEAIVPDIVKPIGMSVFMGNMSDCQQIELWDDPFNKTSSTVAEICGGTEAYAFEIINESDKVFYHVKIEEIHGWVNDSMIFFDALCKMHSDCSPLKCNSGICVECIVDKDCNNSLLCNELSECVECVNNTDCAAGLVCDGNYTCVECASDADCSKNYDHVYHLDLAMYYDEVLMNKTCVNNTCIDCLSSSDCPNTEVYPFEHYRRCLVKNDSSENRCVPCVSDGDCSSRQCSANRCT